MTHSQVQRADAADGYDDRRLFNCFEASVVRRDLG